MDQKVVIITGSTRGFGLAMAKKFLSMGHNVVINGTSEESITKAISYLSDYKEQIAFLPGSVGDPQTHKKLLQTALDKFQGLDIWINNAGIPQPYDYLVNIADETIINITQTNIAGVILGTKTALNYFISQHSGALWNLNGFGSDGDIKPRLTVYGTTKRAVDYFTRATFKENKAQYPWLTLGTINPGMIKTQFLTKSLEGLDQETIEQNTAFNEIFASAPEDIAEKIVPQILSAPKGFSHLRYMSLPMVLSRLYKARKVLKKMK